MSVHPDLHRLDASPPDEERLRILSHARDCAACRDALAAKDPAALFALLALREFDPRGLDDVSRAVASRLPLEPPSLLEAWRERGLPRLLPLAAAAAAALFLLVAGLPGAPPPEGGAPAVFDATRARADVRVTETPGPAQVVDLTVGETQVVMIFAAEIDL